MKRTASVVFFTLVLAACSLSGAATFRNEHYGFSLALPRGYEAVSRVESIPDPTDSYYVSITPESVEVEVVGTAMKMSDDYSAAEKTYYAAGAKSLQEFAAAGAERFRADSTDVYTVVTDPEESFLNGVRSYRFTVSYSANEQSEVAVAMECHAIEGLVKQKILLCFYTKLPEGSGVTDNARRIAESFELLPIAQQAVIQAVPAESGSTGN